MWTSNHEYLLRRLTGLRLPTFSFSTGYNYHWVNSDAVLEYFFNSVRHLLGRSLFYVRNNFFFIDSVARLHSAGDAVRGLSNQQGQRTGQSASLIRPARPGL